MPSLIATAPGADLLPLEVAGTTLSALDPGAITLVAPWPGGEKTASAALKKAHGLTFPAPNTSAAKDAARILWCGRDQAFLLGPAPGDIPGAAVTDQSDGWVALRLDGALAEPALARLVPLDLRPTPFPEGAATKSLLNHMPLVIWRDGPAAYGLMTFRSMAASAIHEIGEALRSVASRSA